MATLNSAVLLRNALGEMFQRSPCTSKGSKDRPSLSSGRRRRGMTLSESVGTSVSNSGSGPLASSSRSRAGLMLFSKEVSQLASHPSARGKVSVYVVTWKPKLSCGDLLFWWSRCQLDGESLRVRHIVHHLPKFAQEEVGVRYGS